MESQPQNPEFKINPENFQESQPHNPEFRINPKLSGKSALKS